MNNTKFLFRVLFIGLVGSILSCSSSTQKTNETEVDKKVITQVSEAVKLIKYLEELGDYVNSRQFPSLIKASSVNEELNGNIHIIDIRHPDYFNKGHIKNAVNIRFNDLPNYFENEIVPFEFDKIIIACYGGQLSSYTTSLLRLMGYGNVYSMRWGMSAWNKEFSKDFWDTATSSKYESKLENTVNDKPMAGNLPKLFTNLETGEDIHKARIAKLFEDGLKDALIKPEEVFENPDKYFIMNYDRKDKYEAGHIPGAIRYKPNGTLGIISEMETIPTDKETVVYCGTGHSSGFVTAYLKLLGYNAHTLEYGNNGFMFDKMQTERSTLSWLPFTDNEIMNYTFVKK